MLRIILEKHSEKKRLGPWPPRTLDTPSFTVFRWRRFYQRTADLRVRPLRGLEVDIAPHRSPLYVPTETRLSLRSAGAASQNTSPGGRKSPAPREENLEPRGFSPELRTLSAAVRVEGAVRAHGEERSLRCTHLALLGFIDSTLRLPESMAELPAPWDQQMQRTGRAPTRVHAREPRRAHPHVLYVAPPMRGSRPKESLSRASRRIRTWPVVEAGNESENKPSIMRLFCFKCSNLLVTLETSLLRPITSSCSVCLSSRY